MDAVDRDVTIYVATGLFTIAVFVVAIVALVRFTPFDPDVGTLAMLTVGFLAFMGVYFVSLVVYRGIQ